MMKKIYAKEGLLESFRKKGYLITPLPFQTKY